MFQFQTWVSLLSVIPVVHRALLIIIAFIQQTFFLVQKEYHNSAIQIIFKSTFQIIIQNSLAAKVCQFQIDFALVHEGVSGELVSHCMSNSVLFHLCLFSRRLPDRLLRQFQFSTLVIGKIIQVKMLITTSASCWLLFWAVSRWREVPAEFFAISLYGVFTRTFWSTRKNPNSDHESRICSFANGLCSFIWDWVPYNQTSVQWSVELKLRSKRPNNACWVVDSFVGIDRSMMRNDEVDNYAEKSLKRRFSCRIPCCWCWRRLAGQIAYFFGVFHARNEAKMLFKDGAKFSASSLFDTQQTTQFKSALKEKMFTNWLQFRALC